MLQKIVERERKRIDWFHFRNIIKNLYVLRTAGFFLFAAELARSCVAAYAVVMSTGNDRWLIKNTGNRKGRRV